MDIAALSIMLNQGKVQQQAGLSVMKLAMGVAAEQSNAVATMANDVAKVTELSVRPHLGANIDLHV